MDINFKKKSPVVKAGIVKHLGSPVILSNQWDSVESDTESLAQEKACQKSVQHPAWNLLGRDNTEGSPCGNAEAEAGRENEFEDLQIYDSLELVEVPDGLKSPPLLLTDVDKLDGRGAAAREHCSKSLSGDQAFSYLSSAIEEECGQGHMVVQKGGYSHVADMTFPAVVADCRQPFHLHAQNGHRSVTPTHSQLQAHRTDLSGPSSVSKENQSQKTPTREECEEQRKASVTSRKLKQVRNDIVTSNKITLGRNSKKHGSYLKTHALKQDVLFKVTQINREEREQQETSSSLSPFTEQDPDMREELGGSGSSACVSASQLTPSCSISLHTSPVLFPVQHQHGLTPPEGNRELQQCSLENLESSPKLRLTPISGAYKVLPPIEKPLSSEDLDWSPGPSVSVSTSAASDSYLIQMERKQQSQPRTSYKAYTLKDYKQLKPDVALSGLGPDYKSIEKTAEKMRRQKQYANAIREQNKNINRIPFIPAKEPKDNDRKVPRMKALEYAKTIAKPPVLQQPKKSQTQRSRGAIEGLNMSELSQLEILKKRHEEEKRAFALLTK